MNNEDRKYLTEQMGECWCDLEILDDHTLHCKKCEGYFTHFWEGNRPFDNWIDFGVVWEWATKQEWFFDLLLSSWKRPEEGYKGPIPNYPPGLYDHHFFVWLIDPTRFPALVVEFLRKRK